MTNMEGMNIGEVLHLANQFIGRGSELETAVSAIDGIVNQISMNWTGPDATAFVGWWHSQHRPNLVNAASAVQGLGQSAINNARQQELASSVQGSSSALGLVGAAVVGSAVGVTAAVSSTAKAAAGGTVAAAANSAPGSLGAVTPTRSLDQLTSGTFNIGGKEVTYSQWCADHGYVPPKSDAGQCAAYAAFRRAQLGLTLPNGNGDSEASSVGLVNSPSSIGVGSLVSVPGTNDNPYGHVMVVEQRLGSNEFRVSEMNAAGLSVNGPSINADNFRTDSILKLSQNSNGSWNGALDRSLVMSPTGVLQGGNNQPLGTVTFSGGLAP